MSAQCKGIAHLLRHLNLLGASFKPLVHRCDFTAGKKLRLNLFTRGHLDVWHIISIDAFVGEIGMNNTLSLRHQGESGTRIFRREIGKNRAIRPADIWMHVGEMR